MFQPVLHDVEVRPVFESCVMFNVCMLRCASDVKAEVRDVVVRRKRIKSVHADFVECVLFGEVILVGVQFVDDEVIFT